MWRTTEKNRGKNEVSIELCDIDVAKQKAKKEHNETLMALYSYFNNCKNKINKAHLMIIQYDEALLQHAAYESLVVGSKFCFFDVDLSIRDDFNFALLAAFEQIKTFSKVLSTLTIEAFAKGYGVNEEILDLMVLMHVQATDDLMAKRSPEKISGHNDALKKAFYIIKNFAMKGDDAPEEAALEILAENKKRILDDLQRIATKALNGPAAA